MALSGSVSILSFTESQTQIWFLRESL